MNVGGGNDKFGTPRQLYDAIQLIAITGSVEDGYQAIYEIINQFSFRNEEDVNIQIILFSDEVSFKQFL